MEIKGIQNIPKNHLPPVLEDSITECAEIELKYKIRATEYWETGSAVRAAAEMETSEEAYKKYWQFRKEYPRCEISLTQQLSFHGGGAVPISLKRLKELASQ